MQEYPIYKILAEHGFFAGEGRDCSLFGFGSVIEYDGEPNEEMEPMNELAKVRMLEYFDKLDKCGRAVAEKEGRPYTGRPRTLDDALAQAREDARRVQLKEGDGGVPLMGGKSSNKTHIKTAELQEPVKPTRIKKAG